MEMMKQTGIERWILIASAGVLLSAVGFWTVISKQFFTGKAIPSVLLSPSLSPI